MMSEQDKIREQLPTGDGGTASVRESRLEADRRESEVDLLLSQIDAQLGGDTLQPGAVPDHDVIESRQYVEGPDSRIEPATVGGAATVLAGIEQERAPLARRQRMLVGGFAIGTIVLLGTAGLALNAGHKQSQQLIATGNAQMQEQRLAKSVSLALIGNPAAFDEVSESYKALASDLRGLASGSDMLSPLSGGAAQALTPLMPLVDRAERSAEVVLGQKSVLTQVGESLRKINRQSSDLLETAETISSLKLQNTAPTAELAATSQLVMLTQRIGKSANEFLTMEGVSPEAVFLLGKDLNSFREYAEALLNGSDSLRIAAAKDPEVKAQLQTLLQQYEQTRTDTNAILGNLQGLVAARDAQAAIVNDSEPMRNGLTQVQQALSSVGALQPTYAIPMALAAALMLASGVALLRLRVRSEQLRVRHADAEREEAETHRAEAERQEREAKRINDANQAAILRLMNELQGVAEGDLTQQATVTEDITGAIADSVNYTVEELRSLVSQVQGTAARVTETTQQVHLTSSELLAASDEQLREIRETGESVLRMATRIQDVSAQAQETAKVAHQSLEVSAHGRKAVDDTIDGMNHLRDQIQETSKRIKRLGESSQEIGEITELISDITEQTNVLALNAAIQAASAGEAGRGFSVVAEEVQRLAERSADATRQIAALVKTIQTDTQDAVAAMENSTQSVVENAKLSDAAGSALGDIDRVTRDLSALIEKISGEAMREADSANTVAAHIQHIFAVTEQAGEGTRSTAQMVQELARTAEALRQSVDRFKIA